MSDLNILRRLLEQENVDGNRMLDCPGSAILGKSKVALLSELELLKHYQRTTSSAGKKRLGLNHLISSLEMLPVRNIFLMKIDFKNEDWYGHFLAAEDESSLLGFALVRANKDAPLRAPPNWDGSAGSNLKCSRVVFREYS